MIESRYPFLALWKKTGFDKFPSIPVSVIIEHYKKSFFDYLRRNGRTPLKELLLENRPKDSVIIDALNELFDRDAIERIIKTAKQMVMAETWELGRLAVEARNRVINGESREKVLQDLGNKIFPQTRGGASIFTLDQKKTLKILYHELQDCIKEIRRKLDIRLKQPDETYELEMVHSEDIRGFFPKIDSLFEDEELLLLHKRSSIADTAAEIIVSRINKCIPTNICSPRTLQNILNAVPIFFQE